MLPADTATAVLLLCQTGATEFSRAWAALDTNNPAEFHGAPAPGLGDDIDGRRPVSTENELSVSLELWCQRSPSGSPYR